MPAGDDELSSDGLLFIVTNFFENLCRFFRILKSSGECGLLQKGGGMFFGFFREFF